MKNVVFVAPYLMDATIRFIDASTRIPNSRVSLVSCDPVEKLDHEIRNRLSAYFRVENIETHELLRGVQAIGKQFGSVDRLLGTLEQIQVSLGQIRDHLKIEGVGEIAANNFRDKSVMKTVLAERGFPCARHQLVTSIEQALQFAAATSYPLIVKPPDGAGAIGTYRCENQTQLVECVSSLRPSEQNPALLEQFITGDEYSFDSVVVDGKMVWHSISTYRPRPLDVVREPWIQWCVIIPRDTDGVEFETVRQVAPGAIIALGLKTGLSHMEWFRQHDGNIAISEVGARPPGAQIMSLMSYAHSIDMYGAWAELMIHDSFDAPSRDFACGAAYLRGMGSGKQIVAVHGLKQIAEQYNDIVVEASLPKRGQTPGSSYEGDGFIIVRHPETNIVENALKDIITNVQIELGNA